MNYYRHGDVPFFKTEKIEGTKVEHKGSQIVAWGEATGHNHQISVADKNDMDVYKITENEWTIVLRTEGTLTHPEHKTLTIAPGTYRIGREREMDWFTEQTRKVID